MNIQQLQRQQPQKQEVPLENKQIDGAQNMQHKYNQTNTIATAHHEQIA